MTFSNMYSWNEANPWTAPTNVVEYNSRRDTERQPEGQSEEDMADVTMADDNETNPWTAPTNVVEHSSRQDTERQLEGQSEEETADAEPSVPSMTGDAWRSLDGREQAGCPGKSMFVIREPTWA
jgi:hypothetical protein